MLFKKSSEVMSQKNCSVFYNNCNYFSAFLEEEYLRKGDLLLIGGRRLMGSSKLALYMALKFAEKEREVLYFDLEENKNHPEERLKNMLQRLEEYRNKGKTASEALQEPRKLLKGIRMDSEPVNSYQELETRIKEKTKAGAIVFIDDLESLRPLRGLKIKDRNKEGGPIIKNLKLLAAEKKILLIVLVHVSRKCEHREPPKAIISDFRKQELWKIPDHIWFVFREWYYNRDGSNETEITIAKSRNSGVIRIKPFPDIISVSYL